MPIPANQILVARLVVKAELAAAGGQAKAIQIQFDYRRIAVAVAPNKANLVAAFTAGPYAALLAATNIGFQNGSANIRWLNDAQDAFLVSILAGVGAIGTDRLPTYAAIFMRLQSALRGRSFQGSKHFAGPSEVDTTGDILVGAGLVRWQALQVAIAAPLVSAEGNTWNPAVVSTSLSQLRTNPTVCIVNDITQVILDRSVGTMRRRKIRTVI